MWTNSRSLWALLFLCLAVVSVSPSRLFSQESDPKVWMYQSELDELTTIISNLEKSNANKQQLLEKAWEQLTEALRQSETMQSRLDEQEKSWKEYEAAKEKETSKLRFEVKLWQAGTIAALAAATVLGILAALGR